MDWLPFPDERIDVNGLYWWKEDAGYLRRLPARMKELVPASVWWLAQHTSGGRLRFVSDTGSLGLRARFNKLTYMNNMPRTGQVGVDLWVDGEYWRPRMPAKMSEDFCEPFFQNLPRERREYCLYLGLYAPIELLALGFDDGATLEPAAPFAVDKPVVYYGTSITQGGCATRAGMSYQAIVSRKLNLDYVNLGFSGSGRGEPALAQAVAEIEASCFVMDWAQNCPTLEEFFGRYDPFLQVIREKHPDKPIVCTTPIFGMSEVWGGNGKYTEMREHVRRVVGERVEKGDGNLHLVEGFELLGPDDRDGLVDDSHPNDIGFVGMAKGLEPVLRRVLGLR